MTNKAKTIPNATEANRLQDLWMKLDSNGPRSEIDRVCKAYEALPLSYISYTDTANATGIAQVMSQGMPTSAFNETLEQAIKRAKEYGIQTVLRWNTRGFWTEHQEEKAQ